jgi:tetratricopeptide (TPR) repeat protein
MPNLFIKNPMKKTFLFITAILFLSCNGNIAQENPNLSPADKEQQQKIIEKYVYNCADKFSYNLPEYQACLDAGLEKDSTIAYLWQQKAMPYFKQMKYEIGMEYIDKAVKYDPQRWQPYRAFIKCIFAKTYRAAIEDFKDCIRKYGNTYEMDHTYKFYIALSHLQLNEFEKAEKIFAEDIQAQAKTGWSHQLDLFYYGISLFEQQKWEEAIEQFDKSLELYPKFADAQFYKAQALARLGKIEKARAVSQKAKENGKAGNTVNEDNAIYERYPYQVRWEIYD